jgi:CheY-like chemotaxis protein
VNVLNNAAKYTPPGGAVEFKAETHGSRAIITIRDNGTGIEQKMLSRIFEPFIQVSNTKYGTSGVGVGLALAKELVELHDGSIVALSAGLGRGSTFVIEFPTVASPAPVEKPVVHIPERSTGALNVLIVDDNQAGCEALGRLLSFRGHKTTLAFTGNDGIVKALEQSPDVILLDIGLPDMEGYDVARRLRFGGSQSFILALTGFGQDDDRRKALDAGCDGHLTKPVGLSDIEAALRSRFAA